MTKRSMRLFFVALILSLLASLPAHADIVWAVAGPHTGPVAALGLSQEAGVKQAVEDINAAGGINGQKIALKSYDDACDPKQAVAVANKIISENIRFALHGTCSSAALAASKTYIDEGTLLINATSSNPQITDAGGPNMFRAMYRDDTAAIIIVKKMEKDFAKRKIVIINDKSTYGLGIATMVRDGLNKNFIKETLFESYDATSHDYSVLVTRLKEVGTEVLFIGGMPSDAALITRQLREAGSRAQVIAGDLSLPEFGTITGAAGDGALFVFPKDPRKESGAKDVLAKLNAYNIPVDGYTLYAYAAAQVLAQAMTKANSEDPKKVAAIIHKAEFNTILGKWNFDSKGDVQNIHQVMYHWHNGEFGETGE